MSQEPPPPTDEPEESGPDTARETVVLLAILVEGGLLVLAALLGWAFDRPVVRDLNWDGTDALRGLAAALPMIGAFFLVQYVPAGPLRRLRRFAEEVVRPLLAPCTIIDLLGISVLAGLGEEILFRGVLLGLMQGWMGWWLALLLTSLLFGLVHAVTLTYAALATVAGFYLGLICRWSSPPNVLIAVVAHAVYDFAALLWLLRGPGSDTVPQPAAPEAAKEKESEP
jgi:membrane protease YdiL (CAAX protease family)